MREGVVLVAQHKIPADGRPYIRVVRPARKQHVDHRRLAGVFIIRGGHIREGHLRLDHLEREHKEANMTLGKRQQLETQTNLTACVGRAQTQEPPVLPSVLPKRVLTPERCPNQRRPQKHPPQPQQAQRQGSSSSSRGGGSSSDACSTLRLLSGRARKKTTPSSRILPDLILLPSFCAQSRRLFPGASGRPGRLRLQN